MNAIGQGYWELRLYEMLPARLPDMVHQLRVEIPPLFAEAGVPAPLGIWDCFAGPQTGTLVYLLHWETLDQRMEAWGRFYGNPAWWRQYEDAHGGEQMLERSHVFVLRASPAWTPASWPADPAGMCELRLVELHPSAPQEAHHALAATDLALLGERGARLLGLFETCIGDRLPQAAVLLAWPDAATRDAAVLALARDEAVREARASERRRHGEPLIGATDAYLLRPIP
jgi:hypothetical protein